MSRERLDEETLAAFLEGALAPDERGRVMRVLSTQPEDYADFLEAAEVAAALNEESGVVPIDRARRRPWYGSLLIAGPLAAAAGVAAVLFVARSDGPADTVALMQGTTLAAVQGVGSVDAALGDQWDQPGWSVVRGATPARASLGTAARIGARVAQLEYAAGAADSLAYRRVEASLAALVASVEGAGPILASFRSLSIDADAERATVARQLREVAGAPAAFDAGAWLETARLAAASGRTEFLAPGGAAMSTLQSIIQALERDPPTADWALILALLHSIAQNSGDAGLTRARIDSTLAAIPR